MELIVAEVRSPKCNNILLIGMTGCGKTSLGWNLAQLLNYGSIDVDQVIEKKSKKGISKIFSEHGQEGFRDIELESIRSLSNVSNSVIAIGAGAVTRSESWETLQSLGYLVWVKVGLNEISRRFSGSISEMEKRPLFEEFIKIESSQERLEQVQSTLEAMHAERAPQYEKADLIFDTSYSTPDTAASLLKKQLVSENMVKNLRSPYTGLRWRSMDD